MPIINAAKIGFTLADYHFYNRGHGTETHPDEPFTRAFPGDRLALIEDGEERYSTSPEEFRFKWLGFRDQDSGYRFRIDFRPRDPATTFQVARLEMMGDWGGNTARLSFPSNSPHLFLERLIS